MLWLALSSHSNQLYTIVKLIVLLVSHRLWSKAKGRLPSLLSFTTLIPGDFSFPMHPQEEGRSNYLEITIWGHQALTSVFHFPNHPARAEAQRGGTWHIKASLGT